ncbi:MAG TPA: DegV family protein [Candidatus Saccharimonadales bacterium]|nr:DegV family protein [Candidatus Saccharimonadales bacterium]
MSNPEKITIVHDCASAFRLDQRRKGISGISEVYFSISADIDGQHKEWVDTPLITDEKRAEFLDVLKRCSKIETSQPNEKAFANTYWDEIQKGKEELAVFVISKGLSGAINSAELGKGLSPQDLDPDTSGLSKVPLCKQANIVVADLKTASIGEALLITQGDMENKRGDFKNATELVQRAEDLSKNLYVAQAIPDLDYLRRSGRIGRANHMIGKVLGIIPIISIDEEGKLEPAVEKMRKWPRTREALIAHVANEVGDRAVRLALVYYETDQLDNLRHDIQGRFTIAEDEFYKPTKANEAVKYYETMIRQQDMVTSVSGGPSLGMAALVLDKRAA